MNISNILAFKNRHRGQAAMLLGNGPSLTTVPQAFLAGIENTADDPVLIGMNRSWKYQPTRYQCFVAPQHWDELCAGKHRTEVVFTTDRFVKNVAAWKRGEHLDVEVVLVKQIRESYMLWKRFSPWLDKGTEAPFAGIFALQLAAWMGFKQIHLLGYDCHNTDGHHYDDVRAKRDVQLKYYSRVPAWAEASGVKIWNWNPGSAIRVFPFKEAT